MKKCDNEIWLPIIDYPNYRVSNFGRIKSLNYLGHGGEQILKQGISAQGYMKINLYDGGRRKSMLVHRLVAQAFIDNPESKPQVNHKNGIKTDNNSINLEWATAKENTDHAYRNGLNENVREASRKNVGEKHISCKLMDRECDQIRLKYAIGNITQRELAEEYNCGQAQISRIINNKQRIKK